MPEKTPSIFNSNILVHWNYSQGCNNLTFLFKLDHKVSALCWIFIFELFEFCNKYTDKDHHERLTFISSIDFIPKHSILLYVYFA